jgi:hypothetical protein
MAEYSEAQLGKRVVAQNGTPVGEVTGVDDGTLLVTVDEDIDRDVVTDLNWDGVVNRETHRLNDRHISNVSEETIRLRV